MYLEKSKHLITKVNIWYKNGKKWASLEYVSNDKIYKKMFWWEDLVKEVFEIDYFPTNQDELKELRKELFEKYKGKDLVIVKNYVLPGQEGYNTM